MKFLLSLIPLFFSSIAFAHEEPTTGQFVFSWDEALPIFGVIVALAVIMIVLRARVKRGK